MSHFPPWKDATWGERAQLVALQMFVWGVVFPAMLVGSVLFLGMMVEGMTEQASERARCQKQAATPYEYHQCR